MTNFYDTHGKLVSLDVHAELRVNCNAARIDIKADGEKIFVYSSLRAAFTLIKMLKARYCSADFLKAVDLALKEVDVTLYWKSVKFGILGSKGKAFMFAALVGIHKIIKP